MRLSIYPKFLLVLVPTFAAMAAIGLLVIGHGDARVDSELLGRRLGDLGARVAVALGKNGVMDNRDLAEDFLGTFGTDSAVLCAELLAADARLRPLAVYPAGIGCKGVTAPMSLNLPIGDTQAALAIHYTDAELLLAARRRMLLTLGVILASLAATLISASVGFRLIVGVRLKKLHVAMMRSTEQTKRIQLNPGRPDELADIISAYNALMQHEQKRESVLHERNQQLDDAGRHDPLTGLFNRRHFEEWAAKYSGDLKQRRRSGAIGLIDVDHFKLVNDTYGHAVGDEVLVAIASRLTDALRQQDTVVRWGGEEILVHVAGRHDIESVASRLLDSFADMPITTTAGPLRITVSVGLVDLPLLAGASHLPIERVVVLADRALYAAKHSGRNRAVCVHALRIENPAQLAALENDLQAGADKGLVTLSTVCG